MSIVVEGELICHFVEQKLNNIPVASPDSCLESVTTSIIAEGICIRTVMQKEFQRSFVTFLGGSLKGVPNGLTPSLHIGSMLQKYCNLLVDSLVE
ncbi:hypothetical protein CGLO_18048 [Colletotrichum gloeosporioides Cg-14]|uniref:Uncharacterized protein n=1 Tax=Colletotrichum gloeosporioides (strain Cg-14) TaxID=1237896 RepID=T0L4Y7_COLGC|nr:hypothetical protein CGLO_18048 [Colletotrichum gloeosporioides Cg-14]